MNIDSVHVLAFHEGEAAEEAGGGGSTGALSYPSNKIPAIVTKADRNHLLITDGFVTSLK